MQKEIHFTVIISQDVLNINGLEVIEIIISILTANILYMHLGYPLIEDMHNNMNQSAKMLNANVKYDECENDIIPKGNYFQGMEGP